MFTDSDLQRFSNQHMGRKFPGNRYRDVLRAAPIVLHRQMFEVLFGRRKG
jgi:hypothetical protein